MIQLRLRVRAECVCCLNDWLPVLLPQLRKTRSLLTRIRMPIRVRNQLVTRNQKNLKRVTDYFCATLWISPVSVVSVLSAPFAPEVQRYHIESKGVLGISVLDSCLERPPILNKTIHENTRNFV